MNTGTHQRQQDLQSVLRRLKKIMALSASSNPGEAAAALHQAERLMAKHGISSEDIELSTIVEMDVQTSGVDVSGMEKHLAALVGTVFGVGLLGCTHKAMKGRIRPKGRLVFVGDSGRVGCRQLEW